MQDDRTCELQVNKTLLFGTSRPHVALGASSLPKLPMFTQIPGVPEHPVFYFAESGSPGRGWGGHGPQFC